MCYPGVEVLLGCSKLDEDVLLSFVFAEEHDKRCGDGPVGDYSRP